MNKETNSQEPLEYSRIRDLKQNYLDMVNTVLELRESKKMDVAAEMEQQANLMAAEIQKLDPSFEKELDKVVGQAYKDESASLNRKEHGTSDHGN